MAAALNSAAHLALINSTAAKAAFPGAHAVFREVEHKPYSAYDIIFLDSTIPGSFFNQICVDFGNKSIAVASETQYRNEFRAYFIAQGISPDALSLCLYTAYKEGDLKKLCNILLANNTFPGKWSSFFSTLATSGVWKITSKI